MKTKWVRAIVLAVGLLSPFTFVVRGAKESREAGQGHLSGLTARIIMSDGTTRNVTIEGVGCSASICSRTFIKGKAASEPIRTWLDSIAAIRDTSPTDALFVLKDGTAQRLALIKDFRVLYLANRLRGDEKLDLAAVRSVDFLSKEKH